MGSHPVSPKPPIQAICEREAEYVDELALSPIPSLKKRAAVFLQVLCEKVCFIVESIIWLNIAEKLAPHH